jgi:hypothetical protein
MAQNKKAAPATEEKTKRVRRDKRTVITEKLEKINNKIADYEKKLAKLKEDKTKLDEKLYLIDNAEAAKAKAEEGKRMVEFITKNNITLEQLEGLINKPE